MIAFAKRAPQARNRRSAEAWDAFLVLLPAIQRHARIAFRHLTGEAKQDAIAEIVANAAVAFARLVELGKIDLAYASALARFAVRQFHDGRRVGSRLRINDVLSPYAQHRKRFRVETLDRFDEDEGHWQEAVVQDTRTSPVPDIVGFRIDFAEWLSDLPDPRRRVAEALAMGHGTGEVACRFNLSAGRVSQLRRELRDAWRQFQGEYRLSASAGTAE